MKFPPQRAVYHDDRAVDVADQAVAQENVRNFPVASLPDAWQRADGGDARGFASRLSSEGLVHQLRQFGLALPDGHRRPDPPFSTLGNMLQNLFRDPTAVWQGFINRVDGTLMAHKRDGTVIRGHCQEQPKRLF